MSITGSQYTLKAYQVLLMTNRKKRLLVEGKSDKQFFSLIFHELSRAANYRGLQAIKVDSASDFIDIKDFLEVSEKRKSLGNREIVERVCRQISGKPYSHKLIGFVDREFREFNCSDTEELKDKIKRHNVDERIVWSRGHSIENYLFDKTVLAEALRFHISEDWFSQTIDLFEQWFRQMIDIGCALSIVARELELIKKIETSIHWQIFESHQDNLALDFEKYKSEIILRKIVEEDEIEYVFERYYGWKKRIKKADFDLVRWLCHGHIGFRCILALFRLCIVKTCPDSDSSVKPEKYLGNFKDEKHFNFCTNVWIRRAVGNRCEHPLKVFETLGFDIF